ncbi:MAG: YihY/virulence factor BrkB family protein [Bacilli bacterium]|nr:YihY/virulence factor BrkB family protein [Bacilli bacterium]
MTKKINKISRDTKDRFINYITKIWEIIKKPEMGILPGQLAFFMLLSLVPIITLSGYAAGLFNINFNTIIDMFGKIVPGGIDTIVPYLNGNTIDLKLAIIFIWMFYLASNGCNTVILISNQIYGLNQSNFIKRRIKAIFMTLAIVLLVLFMLIVPVFGNKLIELLALYNLDNVISKVYRVLQGPITWLIMFIFIRSLYEFAPDRVRKNSHLNTGSLFATMGFIVVTEVYKMFANNMTTYNMFYGALSNIALIMLWLYFLSFVFVIGLSLNYGEELDKEKMEKTGALRVLKNR